MTQFEEILKILSAKRIHFVLVGGFAASAHGSSYVTNDLDVCYERTPENIHGLVGFLKSINAKLRGVPTDLPFLLDEKIFSFGINFTFQTDLGYLDLLGEIAGVGNFAKVLEFSEPMDLFGHKIDVLSLEGLIKAKRAVGRPKDIAHLKELEAIRELKKLNK